MVAGVRCVAGVDTEILFKKVAVQPIIKVAKTCVRCMMRIYQLMRGARQISDKKDGPCS